MQRQRDAKTTHTTGLTAIFKFIWVSCYHSDLVMNLPEFSSICTLLTHKCVVYFLSLFQLGDFYLGVL